MQFNALIGYYHFSSFCSGSGTRDESRAEGGRGTKHRAETGSKQKKKKKKKRENGQRRTISPKKDPAVKLPRRHSFLR